MDLLQILFFYKKYWLVILITSLIFATVFGVLTTQLKPWYEASTSIFIGREAQASSGNFYNYDGYYSQQAAERFTDTVVALLKNKDVIRMAGSKSGFGESATDVDKILSFLKVKKQAPQVLTIIFTYSNKDKSISFIENLSTEVTKRTGLLNEKGDKLLALNVVESKPFVEEKSFSPLVIFALVFALTLFIDSVVLSVLEALRGVSGRK